MEFENVYRELRKLKGDWVDVRAFGAEGDGVTDDTTAIQDAINAGKKIIFPEGIYLISGSGIYFLSSQIIDFNNAVLKYTGTGSAVSINQQKNVVVNNINIDLASAGVSAIGLHIKGLWFGNFFQPRVDRKTTGDQTGIRVETSSTGGNNFGSYILNFYQPYLKIGCGNNAFSTAQTTGDNVKVTHLQVYGGWMTGGDKTNSEVIILRSLGSSMFMNIAIDYLASGNDAYDIATVDGIVIIPGEMGAASGAGYQFNFVGTACNNVIIIGAVTTGYSMNTSTFIPSLYYCGGLNIRSGETITKHISKTFTWDPGAVADGGVVGCIQTVSGAAVGDPAVASLSSIGANNILISAYVDGANSVRVIIFNKTGGTLDLASGTLRIDVWKH